MSTPTVRSRGALAVSNNNSAVSVIAGTIVDGDLIVIFAGKDTSSNYTFPAGFTKAAEVATYSFALGLGWKWGAAADSGATFVCSVAGGGGANQVFHAHAVAFAGVQSTATPLKGLQLRVDSKDWIATTSYQSTAPAQFVVGALVQGDNITVDSSWLSAYGWTTVDCYGTSTGNDGQQYLLTRTVATSGTYLAPSSVALGTAHQWHALTFGLDGVASEIYTQTRTDSLGFVDNMVSFRLRGRSAAEAVTLEDSGPLARWFSRRHGEEYVTVLDSGGIFRNYDAHTFDMLDLLADLLFEYISGTGVYPVVSTDTLTLTDGALSVRFTWRALADALAAADDARVTRLRSVRLADGMTIVDHALAGALRGSVRADDTVVVDGAFAPASRFRRADDAVDLTDDADLRRLLFRLLTDAVTTSDAALTGVARVLAVLLSEELDLTDAVALRRALWCVAGDAITSIDAALAIKLRALAGSDALAVDDAALSSVQRWRFADAVADLTDAATLRRALWRAAGDAFELIDAALAAKLRELAVSDALAVDDAALASSLRQRVAVDTVDLTDAAALRRLLFRLVADGLVADDEAMAGASRRLVKVVSEGLNLTDAAALRRALWRHAGDVLWALDSELAYRLRALLTMDAIDTADESQRARAFGRSADDAFTVDDARFLQRNLTRHLTSTMGAADSALTAKAIARALSDALTLLDEALHAVTGLVVRRAGDAVELSDGTQTVRLSLRVLQDGFSTADGADRALRFARLVADGLLATDEFTATKLTKLVVTLTGSDGLLVDDAFALARVRSPVLLDAILALADAAAYSRVFGRASADALRLADAPAFALRRVLLAADALEVADGRATVTLLTRGLIELLGIGDSADAQRITDASLRYVLRVLLGFDRQPQLGVETVCLLGHDDLRIELGGLH